MTNRAENQSSGGDSAIANPTYNPGPWMEAFQAPFGQFVWALLNSTDYVARMEVTTDLQRPAVEGIAYQLLDDSCAAGFSDELRDDWNKKMIGHMVRQIMKARGYEHQKSSVEITRAPVFSFGSRYRRIQEVELHVYRSSSDFRDFILAERRLRPEELPIEEGVRRWNYDGVVGTKLRAAIVLGIRDTDAVFRQLSEGALYRGYQQRSMRVSENA